MKRLLIFVFVALPLVAQTPTVGSHTASATGSVKLSVNVGDLPIVFYVPDPKVAASCSDSAGNAYTALGETSATVDTAEIFGFSARPTAANAALTITCTPTTTYRQVYAADISNAGNPTAAAFSGSSASGKATGTIQASAGDLVLAMVEASSSVANSSGWTALSTLNSNLLASQTASGPVTANFSVSGNWNLVLVDIPPAALPVQTQVQISTSFVNDDGSIPQTTLLIQWPNGNTTQALSLVSDATGKATGSLTLSSSLNYTVSLYVNGQGFGGSAVYAGALVLAAAPQISQLTFSVTFFHGTGQVKAYNLSMQ